MRVLIFALVSILFSSTINGQVKKFGKIDKGDFSDYNPKFDTTAAGVVFFEVGKAYFTSNMDCYFERHVRIKVLNEEGFDLGDIAVGFNKDLKQGVDKIKAQTYNLKDDRIEVTKLGKKDVFEEHFYDDFHAKKFTLPALTKGSIFEYSYRKKVGSPFYLPDWTFHKEIPVKYSKYEMRIPNAFSYQTIIKGIDTVMTKNVVRYHDDRGGGRTVTVEKTNLPAVIDLPFIDSTDDFVTEVFNQLLKVYYPGGGSDEFFKNWDKVADEVRKHPGIGKQRLNNDMKNKAEEIAEGANTDIEKMNKVFDYVSSSMNWNGRSRLVSENGIRDAYKEKTGSSADINLMLMEMLNHVGIKTHLGLISTKSNGAVITSYPIVNQFNHIVAVSEIENGLIMLDATGGERYYKLPPVKNLYRKVLLIEPKDHGWFISKPLENTSSTQVLDYSVEPTGMIYLDFDSRYTGYAAHNFRSKNNENAIYAIAESYIDDSQGIQIDSASVRHLEEKSKPVTFSMKLIINEEDSISSGKDIIYLNPLLFLKRDENPFKKSEREFPIIFPFPFKERVIINIRIPKGYIFEEIPESNSVVLGDNKASLRFIAQVTGNTVNILSDFSINQTRFEANEYDALKNLFQKQVNEHARQIVIKKL